jgi:hypothetical protein
MTKLKNVSKIRNKFEEIVNMVKPEKGEKKNQEDKKNEIKREIVVGKEKKVEKTQGIVKINRDEGKARKKLSQKKRLRQSRK